MNLHCHIVSRENIIVKKYDALGKVINMFRVNSISKGLALHVGRLQYWGIEQHAKGIQLQMVPQDGR